MLDIVVHSLAEDDLLEAANFICTENPEAARKLISTAKEDFIRISEFPYVGKICGFETTQYKNMRYLQISGFRNYLIFYLVTDSTIEIVRILHGARDLETLFED
jgi:toxin ParE1/3/4